MTPTQSVKISVPAVKSTDYISIASASKLLNLSMRRVQEMCQSGVFLSAHKPGSGKNSHWQILRNEVLARKSNGSVPIL